jgi:hypothetical protein
MILLLVEQVAEALEGAQEADFDGAFADAEDGGSVAGGQLLQVAEDEDFAIAFGQAIECGAEAELPLGAAEAGAGAALFGEDPLGEFGHRFVGQSQRFFATDAAAAGTDVAAMDIDEPFAGELPEPGIEGQRAPLEVIVEPLGGFGEGVLDDVGGIDPGGEAAIKPDGDELPQAAAMAVQEAIAGVGVAIGGIVEQSLGIRFSVGRHVF